MKFHDWVQFCQEEDGIRDDLVTGVKTCALPILKPLRHIMAGKDMLLYHASQLSRGEEKMSSFFSYAGSLRIAWARREVPKRRKQKMAWYRNDKAAVAEVLRRGERPDLATTMASGPLDELVALHQELGIFAVLDELEVQRARAGVPDELLLRTLATLPFVEQASLSGASEVLFREPAVLLQLGWAPVQIRAGSNGRHRHPEGRQEESLPCHPDTLRDALRRVGESAWLQVQQAGVQSLYERQLVRGKVYAVDGSGLGDDFRLVALVCVSATRPIIVAWRLLSGQASEESPETAVVRSPVAT